MSEATWHHRFGMAAIAVFKLIKGILLLVTAVGLLKLVHADLSALVEHWVTLLRMDPDNERIHHVMEMITNISPKQLKAASAGSFFYAALLLTEGIGLWLEKRWAEYLTVLATSTFIPLELYEIWVHLTGIKLAVLILNVVIVLYLIRMLRRDRGAKTV
ncbi:MAG: DUF2127 domain-containing protein [Verrucomicrobiota bacterium]